MSTSQINTETLIESLSYSLSSVEYGLQFVDSGIFVINGAIIDILAVDKDRRLVLMCTSNRPANNQMLVKAVVAWEWVGDYRADFAYGIRTAAGLEIDNVPPRLLLLAPSFSKPMVQMANYCQERIDIELLLIRWDGTFDSSFNIFQFSENPFVKLNLVEFGLPGPAPIENFNRTQDTVIKKFRQEYDARHKSGIKAYQPFSF